MHSSLDQLTDEELAERFVAAGGREERLFAELFRRRRSDVWRICYAFFGNAQDAEDLTQDVFFTAYRKLSTFEGRASLRSWLHRVAVNACKNELRRRSRRPLAVGDAPLEEVPVETAGPEARVLTAMRARRLGEALQELKPADRRLIEQADLEQRPYREMARELGLSLSGVKMRVLRARLALQAAYRRLEGGGSRS